MKKEPTKAANSNETTAKAVATGNAINRNKGKLYTVQLDKVTLHYQGTDHSYQRHKGRVEISPEEIGSMSEGLALFIILLAGKNNFYLPPETYFAIRDGVWFHLDRDKGGLNADAEELFADDEDILAAAALHREAQAKKSKAE